MTAPVTLGLDVGGTTIKYGYVGRDGRISGTRTARTQAERGPDAVVDRILAVVAKGVGNAPAEVRGVGIVVPGLVDEAGGVAISSGNLGWRDVPLRALVEERTGLPSALGHDVRGAARAEIVAGPARGAADVLFIALGTGIGAAFVLRGAPYTGAHQRAAEFGHMSVRPDGPRCPCGAVGCVEALASGPAIEARYRGAAGEQVTAVEVARRAVRGDVAAARVWAEAVGALAAGVATLVVLLDPAQVIIGGGVAAAGVRLLAPLRRAVDAALPSFAPAPPIVAAAHRRYGGAIGAGALAWARVSNP